MKEIWPPKKASLHRILRKSSILENSRVWWIKNYVQGKAEKKVSTAQVSFGKGKSGLPGEAAVYWPWWGRNAESRAREKASRRREGIGGMTPTVLELQSGNKASVPHPPPRHCLSQLPDLTTNTNAGVSVSEQRLSLKNTHSICVQCTDERNKEEPTALAVARKLVSTSQTWKQCLPLIVFGNIIIVNGS